MADDYSREIADLALRRAGVALVVNKPSPDAAAQANRVARATGLPAATVDDNLAKLSQQVELARTRQLLARNPELAVWSGDARNAAVASDDMDALARNAKYWKGAVSGSIAPIRQPEGTLWNSLQGIGTTFMEGMRRLPSDIQRIGADWLPSFDLAAPGTPRLGDYGAENARRATMRAEARTDAATPEFKSRMGRYLYGGGSSLAQMAPSIGAGVIAGPIAGLAVAGAQTGLPAYSKYRNRGGTRGEALVGGGAEGIIEVATEKLPMGFLVERLGKIGAGKFLSGYLGRDLPGEAVAALSQNAVDTAIANPNKTWGEYLDEQLDALAQAAVGSLMAGGFFTGVGAAARRLSRAEARNTAAADDADALGRAMDSAAASKTRTRDPEAFRAFIDRFTQGSRVENVFVPAETVATYFQSMDLDYREDDFWSDYAPQIDEGLQTGGDVVVPTSAAAAHLSGTPTWEAIKGEVRTSPGGPSLSEVEAQREGYDAAMEQLGADMAEQMAAAQEADAPRAAIYRDVRDKLTNAGHTQGFADINAELGAQRYATRAARTGRELTGGETANIIVNAVLPENLAPIVAKDAGDVGLQSVINVMRRGLGVKTGRAGFGDSLVEWIAKNGGIEDKGGDLSAIGADTWHRGKPGKRKLIRPVQSGQGGMFGAAENANTPDDLALRAQEAGYFPAGDRPEIGQLFAAIETELRGEPVYAQYAGGLTAEDNTRAAADELAQILEQRGLDPATATDREITATLNQYRQEQVGGYQQTFGDGPRGQISFTDGRSIIDLFQSRNTSTFAHEMGHQWLEELRDDALLDTATDQARADWQVVQDWFAANGHPVVDGVIPVDAHEMWARGIERYLMEGSRCISCWSIVLRSR